MRIIDNNDVKRIDINHDNGIAILYGTFTSASVKSKAMVTSKWFSKFSDSNRKKTCKYLTIEMIFNEHKNENIIYLTCIHKSHTL